MGIYAVIKTGGKQYRVAPGDIVQVEKLPVLPGDAVEITDVFMLVKDDDVAIGNPTVANVRVIAEVVTQGRGEKIRIFKKRRRKHYQKTMGHRQYYSAIRIIEIVDGDQKYRASDADVSRIGISAREGRADAVPAVPLVRAPEAAQPKSEPESGNVIASLPIGASPEFESAAPPSVAAPPRMADHDFAESDAEEVVPAAIAREPFAAATLPADNGGTARPDALAEAPEVPHQPAPQAAPIMLQEPTPAPVIVAVAADPAEVTRANLEQPIPAARAAAPNEAESRRKNMSWFLAPLLALLLGGLGWWFRGDEPPAIAPAGIDTRPPDPIALQATPPPAPRPPVRELRTRTPARALAPSTPAQPPD